MPSIDTLSLSRDEMRTVGYRVIDLLVEHLAGLSEAPVGGRASPAELEHLLAAPLPEAGRDPVEVVNEVWEQVLSHVLHVDHPRFFGFVPSPSNYMGVMADAMAAGTNVFAGTWLEASGPAAVELATVRWLRDLLGLPEAAGGLCVSGGSMANLTGLAVARHTKLGTDASRAVAYYSDQTHSSVSRALQTLALSASQRRVLPSDSRYRLDVSALEEAVAADRAAGRQPFCVVVNAGTTNTGAVDPLPAVARVCERERLWVHADGAYGAAAALCPEGRIALEGLNLVDSVSLDPHKWLFQPYELGCILLRDAALLPRTFATSAAYLKDVESRTGEVNFGDRGLQLTRTFRALKLWMSLQVFGRAAFAKAVAGGFARARLAEACVRREVGWEIVTPAQMGVVSFRAVAPGRSVEAADALNRHLVSATLAEGYALVSSTELRGRVVLRMCPINPRTTDADIRETVSRLSRTSERLQAG